MATNNDKKPNSYAERLRARRDAAKAGKATTATTSAPAQKPNATATTQSTSKPQATPATPKVTTPAAPTTPRVATPTAPVQANTSTVQAYTSSVQANTNPNSPQQPKAEEETPVIDTPWSPGNVTEQETVAETKTEAPSEAPKAEETFPTYEEWKQTVRAGNNGRNDYGETPEEEKKRIRREHARAAIAALGDMGTAIAKLYYGAGKGAVLPVTKKEDTLSEANRQRFEAWKKDQLAMTERKRKEQDALYTQYKADRDYWLKTKREERLAEKSANDLEISRLRAEQLQIATANKKELTEAQLKNLDARNKEIQARIQKLNTENDRLSKGLPIHPSSRTSGGRGGTTKYYGSFQGKEYKTKEDHDAAVMRRAKELEAAGKLKLNKYRISGKSVSERDKIIRELKAEIELLESKTNA